MAKLQSLTGNEAAANALRQARPDVCAVYPITPQTELMHKFAEFVANGVVDTEMILVESEHSAMSACIGASAAGARVVTATSANGLALMWEMVYIAASCRLPIVMPEVNRALSGPINIHCDHSDTMGARDAGWIQIYCENSQEAYDNILQAVRIAEHPDVLLPVIVALDGFIISHTLEGLEVNDTDVARDFIGEYQPQRTLLDVDDPHTFGVFTLQNYYFEYRKQQVDAMARAMGVIAQIGEEYGKLTGRCYGILDTYRCEDADVVMVGLGSTMGTMKDAADRVREQDGIAAGVVAIRVFRPFPFEEIRAALSGAAAVGVMDRAISYGLGGPVFNEVRSALYGQDSPMASYIYGLGGRDLSLDMAQDALRDLAQVKQSGESARDVRYLGLRE